MKDSSSFVSILEPGLDDGSNPVPEGSIGLPTKSVTKSALMTFFGLVANVHGSQHPRHSASPTTES